MQINNSQLFMKFLLSSLHKSKVYDAEFLNLSYKYKLTQGKNEFGNLIKQFIKGKTNKKIYECH